MNQPTLRPAPAYDHYEVARDFQPDGISQEIVVPKWFRYDGASIPAAAWQLTYTPYHPDVMTASVVHDWLYYNHQVERDVADDLFYDILRANGVGTLIASTMWGAVKSFGGLFWDNDDADVQYLVSLCARLRGRPNFDRYRFPPEISALCPPG